MQVGDLVKRKDCSGGVGVYVGDHTYINRSGGKDYTCSKVYWNDLKRIRPIQSDLLEVIK